MEYKNLIQSYRDKKIKLVSYGSIKEDKTYILYKIKINNKSKRTLIITTGFHGEEFNGPISLSKIINEVIAYSKKKKVNLIIYPCINPSGFEHKRRYNLSKEKQNNDFIRYKTDRGWVGNLINKNEKFIQIKIIKNQAKETLLLKKDLFKQNIVPVAILDIHQDDDLLNSDFYAYIFDKSETYRKIMFLCDKFAKRASNAYATNFDHFGREYSEKIDGDGFLISHDGTLTDMFFQLGSEFSAVIEINIKTPLSTSKQINKTWIESLIDLTSKSNKLDLKIPKKLKN